MSAGKREQKERHRGTGGDRQVRGKPNGDTGAEVEVPLAEDAVERGRDSSTYIFGVFEAGQPQLLCLAPLGTNKVQQHVWIHFSRDRITHRRKTNTAYQRIAFPYQVHGEVRSSSIAYPSCVTTFAHNMHALQQPSGRDTLC